MTRNQKLIAGIVGAGIINLLIFTSMVAAITSPSPDPTEPETTSTTTPASPDPSERSAPSPTPSPSSSPSAPKGSVLYVLHRLEVANPKPSGYDRDEFGQRWADVDRNGCDQRNDVLRRDMVNLHTKPGTMAASWLKAL